MNEIKHSVTKHTGEAAYKKIYESFFCDEFTKIDKKYDIIVERLEKNRDDVEKLMAIVEKNNGELDETLGKAVEELMTKGEKDMFDLACLATYFKGKQEWANAYLKNREDQVKHVEKAKCCL